MLIITIDMGTSNTRLRLWNNENLIANVKENHGIAEFNGSKKLLIECLNECKTRILKKVESIGIEEDMIDAILASGMITSNIGMIEVPHLIAPVKIEDLAKNIVFKTFPEFSNIPIGFIAGVKNKINGEKLKLDELDMMRGEEVEVFGLSEKYNINNECVFILPGSHCKIVKFSKEREIESCITTLSGELLWNLTNNTILKSSLKSSFVKTIEQDVFFEGVKYSEKLGINRSAFLVRSMEQLGHTDENQRANFLLGAVLNLDIMAFMNSEIMNAKKCNEIVIAGNDLVIEPYKLILQKHGFDNIRLVRNDIMNFMSSYGVMKIYDIYKNLNRKIICK